MSARGPWANALRLQALRSSSDYIVSRQAVVTNYNPANYTARVQIQPEGIQTGDLPIAAAWIGNNWGLFAPPSIGDMCVVEFVDGDLDVGFIEARFFNNDQRPLSVPSGEFWLVHQNGQFIKLLNSGALTLSDGHGASLTLNGDGSITSQAMAWHHTGDINVDGDVVASGISLVNHPHSGVQPGGGTSGPPVAT